MSALGLSRMEQAKSQGKHRFAASACWQSKPHGSRQGFCRPRLECANRRMASRAVAKPVCRRFAGPRKFPLSTTGMPDSRFSIARIPESTVSANARRGIDILLREACQETLISYGICLKAIPSRFKRAGLIRQAVPYTTRGPECSGSFGRVAKFRTFPPLADLSPSTPLNNR